MTSYFVHPKAICESVQIGAGTKIWAFAHVLPGARIGRGCDISDGVFVENGVLVGDRVTVRCGVQLWGGLTLEDDVFVGPNATFTNDPFPRSKVHPEQSWRTIVRRGASIGANATILPGIEIGFGAMVGAGAVVTRSVPPNAIVVGNPARISGYVQTIGGEEASFASAALSLGGAPPGLVTDLGVGGATLHEMRLVKDLRGELTAGEFERNVPFTPKRYFAVYNVSSREVRGEHAHKRCNQFIICIHGSCNVLLDDGRHRRELILDRPNLGVFMPAMVWSTQHRHSNDTIVLVFASEFYDPNDYIRSYAEFRELVVRDA
jgi:acetyltransferase-like isoleucine patch superfamily enzyme/dTDP-4-dehydrorhamnose 3,5-epimerase-like enzyme